ncbi:cysteine-rich CWC family protein [Aquabacterium sp.]|uniref:cysteine-rich CWC family protein n=1 Tax=Aquabacterium sp. TaxID=1872578 RepID=UPI0035B0CCBE
MPAFSATACCHAPSASMGPGEPSTSTRPTWSTTFECRLATRRAFAGDSPVTHLCPICGQPNQCARAAQPDHSAEPDGACWCQAVQFAPDALSRVPTAQRGLSCICARCATKSSPPSSMPLPTRDKGA